MAVLAPMPRASEATATEREARAGAKDADGVTEILGQHVAMLPEGGGDEVARARAAQMAAPAASPSRRASRSSASKAPSISRPYSRRNGAG